MCVRFVSPLPLSFTCLLSWLGGLFGNYMERVSMLLRRVLIVADKLARC